MFYAIPNLSAETAAPLPGGPWSVEPAPDDMQKADKDRFRKWSMNPMTKHCFFSLSEGLDPSRRVSDTADNPAVLLHGFVADYDYEIQPAQFDSEYIYRKCKTQFPPNYVSKTHSGNGRAVWLFEEPIRVANTAAGEAFLAKVAKELKVKDIWPSYDKASERPGQYFERGRDWIPVSEEKIPSEMLEYWMYKSGSDVSFTTDQREITVPIDEAAKRVEELFPGKWKGPFELNARGPAFWRPDSSNPTSAVVRAGGMQDFGGDEPFVPWSKILGHAWVEKFHVDRIGKSVVKYWNDDRHFWEYDPDSPAPPVPYNLTNLERMLRVEYNLSKKPLKGKAYSELDEVVNRIVRKRIKGVGPFVHYRPGPLRVGCNLFLNSSFARPMEPAPKEDLPKKFGDGFPFLKRFLVYAFPKNPKTDDVALEFFLAWLRYAYANAYNYTPRRGHACIFNGDKETGKSLLIDIVSYILGGFGSIPAKPFRYAVGSSNHNDDLFESPVWSIDDEHIDNNYQHAKYSNFVKTTVAWNSQRMEKKFFSSCPVLWFGRLMVAMNRDGQSARLLPNAELSITDKFMLFKFGSKGGFPFPPQDTIVKTLREELPHFCRWLLDWRIPDHCIGTSRLGIKPYHDPDLMRDAFEAGVNYSFFELLQVFLINHQKEAGEDRSRWIGTSSELYLSIVEMFPKVSSDITSRSVGRSLNDLRARGLPIKQVRSSRGRVWEVPYDIDLDSSNVPEEVEHEDDEEGVSLTDADLEQLNWGSEDE